jgi:hypothetical protein
MLSSEETGHGATSSLPFERQFSMGQCAVFQVHIDKILVCDPCLLRQAFEIRNGILIQSNRDLLLQVLRVGVFG